MNESVAIDYKNAEEGNSALHFAAANGHLECITKLLEHNASINLQNNSKNTALHWAGLCGQLEAIKLICEWHEKHPDSAQKADPNVKN